MLYLNFDAENYPLNTYIKCDDSKNTNLIKKQNSIIPSTRTEKWSYLTPIIGMLSLGLFFDQQIPIGIAIGFGSCALSYLTVTILSKKHAIRAKDITNSTKTNRRDYYQFSFKNEVISTLVCPIFEELLFRGIVQPCLLQSILFIAPTACCAFAKTSFSLNTSMALVSTSVLFGLAHKINGSNIQAISTTISGIMYGILMIRFGIAPAIAAHMTHNTFFVTLVKVL